MKLLVVEDNYILAKNVVKYLSLQGMKGEFVRTWEEALKRLSEEAFSLVILDLNLPGIDGLEALGKIRGELRSIIPVIILTSSSTSDDVIHGLEAGADDYIAKPFDYGILLARINAVMRRELPDKSESVEVGWVRVDFAKKKAWKDGTEVILSSLEFDLLAYFVRNRGAILSRSDIYEHVWGEFDAYAFSRVVDIYVGYLRKKLGKDFILTKKGNGYYVNDESSHG